VGTHPSSAFVTESTSVPRTMSDAAADLLAAALFIGFVGLLFWGYLEPGVPLSEISAIPFVGSLGTVLWANVMTDRRSCALPFPAEPHGPSS